jgi:hypothetical protein
VRIFYPECNKEDIIKTISDGLADLAEALPLAKVMFFGSYAKGGYTVHSDVDLLVVYRGLPRPDAYSLVKKILKVPRLEPHIYTEEEYEMMRDVLDKMLADGCVILFQS